MLYLKKVNSLQFSPINPISCIKQQENTKHESVSSIYMYYMHTRKLIQIVASSVCYSASIISFSVNEPW